MSPALAMILGGLGGAVVGNAVGYGLVWLIWLRKDES